MTNPTQNTTEAPTRTSPKNLLKNRTAWVIAGAAVLVLGIGGTAYAVTDGFDRDEDRIVPATLTAQEPDDSGTGAQNTGSQNTGATGSGSTGADSAISAPSQRYIDDDDVPLTEQEAASAIAAAIAAVGEGTITDLDRSDDRDHAFEVEVRFADGTDVEVELDESFTVVRIDYDRD